ncbi:MAG: hypothetical protein AAFY99_00030 [Pseudomonadota bacterium]
MRDQRVPTTAIMALFCCAFLAGCLTSTPPRSLIKLANWSPMDSDPRDIRVAVQTPEYISIRDGDIRMRLVYEAGDVQNSLVEEYIVMVNPVDRKVLGLPAPMEEKSRTLIGELNPEDAASLLAAQRQIRDLRDAGDSGKGSLTVIASGCATKDLPEGPVLVTIWLQTNPSETFFIVARNNDLRKTAAKAQQNLDDIERC